MNLWKSWRFSSFWDSISLLFKTHFDYKTNRQMKDRTIVLYKWKLLFESVYLIIKLQCHHIERISRTKHSQALFELWGHKLRQIFNMSTQFISRFASLRIFYFTTYYININTPSSIPFLYTKLSVVCARQTLLENVDFDWRWNGKFHFFSHPLFFIQDSTARCDQHM